MNLEQTRFEDVRREVNRLLWDGAYVERQNAPDEAWAEHVKFEIEKVGFRFDEIEETGCHVAHCRLIDDATSFSGRGKSISAPRLPCRSPLPRGR